MSETLTGTCLCGGVELEVTDPQALGYCHCSRCQHWVGSSLAGIVVAKENFGFAKGEDLVKTYESHLAPRNFCSNCGSSLWDDLGAVNFVVRRAVPRPRHEAQLPPAGGLQGELGGNRRRRPAVRRAARLTVDRISELTARLDGVSESRRDGLLQWRYHGRVVARQLDAGHVVIRDVVRGARPAAAVLPRDVLGTQALREAHDGRRRSRAGQRGRHRGRRDRRLGATALP